MTSTKQHGFSKGKSCTTSLPMLSREISWHRDEKNPVYVDYLHFQRAFEEMQMEGSYRD